MIEAFKYLETIKDLRQAKKVLHKLSDIVALVFLATLGNANEWVEIELFGRAHEGFLRKYLELANGIPSHDTIQRVFAMISSESLQRFKEKWTQMLNTDEGIKVRKLLALDGKTQRGTGTKYQKANHIVSAIDENGFSLGEVQVGEKTNEITAIPELLDALNVKGHIITTDAMGTQKEIAKKIHAEKANYVLSLKGNQSSLQENVRQYFDDPELLSGCAYKRTVEKARGGIEVREYWQTDDVSWIPQRESWPGLKSIAMTRNTITKDGKQSTDTRLFISSLKLDVEEIARAIRGHWMVESHHWHLDVTFKEDANRTIEKTAAFNLSILKKLSLNVLKLLDVGKKNISMKLKRFMICATPEKHLEAILSA